MGKHANRAVAEVKTIIINLEEKIEAQEEQIEVANELIESLQQQLAAQTYHGNSVAHWHDKAKAYGDMVFGIGPILGAGEDESVKDAAMRVVAERDKWLYAMAAFSCKCHYLFETKSCLPCKARERQMELEAKKA